MIFLRVLPGPYPKSSAWHVLRQRELGFVQFGRGRGAGSPDHAIAPVSHSNTALAHRRRAIVGINGVVLTAWPRCLVLGRLDRIFYLLALVALALVVSLPGGKRGLDSERLQPVKDFLRDGTIDPHAAEPDAVIHRFGAERAAADISLRIAALASVLNMQASPQRAHRNKLGNRASPRRIEPRPIYLFPLALSAIGCWFLSNSAHVT